MPIDRVNLDEAPDDYSDDEDAHMVSLAGAVGSKLTIANQSVFVQRQLAQRREWEAEEHYLPAVHLENEPCTALRWRNAVPGLPAVVSARLFDERSWGSGGAVAPFTGTLAASGAVTASLPIYTRAQWPPADDVEFAILADLDETGLPFAAIFQNRDDLDSTYKWHAYAGDGALGYAQRGLADAEPSSPLNSIGYSAVVLGGGSRTPFRHRMPRAGYYDFFVRWTSHASAGAFGSCDVGIGIDPTGVSNPAPASAVDTQLVNGESRELVVDDVGPFAAGDYAQLVFRTPGGVVTVVFRGLTFGYRPSKIS